MEPWNKRPFEYRRLFNPAFCAVLLLKAMNAYKKESGEGMPFSLSFLILPLCLYEDSRRILNQNKNSSFLKIVANHSELLAGFPNRARSLIPYTLEGLGYAFNVGSFDINDGSFFIRNNGVKKEYMGSIEVKNCQKAAVYLGKAFAKVKSKITIYSRMGVKP